MNLMKERSWEEIERETLTNTNAQRVLQLLRNLEGRRDRVQSRWIWELLQNAARYFGGQDKQSQMLSKICTKGCHA